MSNAQIAYRNRVDDGVFSGGNYEVTLPLTNLQNRQLSQVARTVDLDPTNTQFVIDIGVNQLALQWGIIAHNFSLDALYRVQCADEPTFAAPVYDSGWNEVWPAVYSTYQLTWQHPNFLYGKYLAEEIEGYDWKLIKNIDFLRNVRYWKFMFDDQTNSAGYLQFGRVFIGPAWQCEVNISPGAGIQFVDPSESQVSRSGAKTWDKLPKYRNAKFSTDFMSDDEAFGSPFEIQRQSGVTEEVIYTYNPEDTLHLIRRQIYGTLKSLDMIEQFAYDLNKSNWQVEESIG